MTAGVGGESGFTLVELIVAITVTGLVAAIMFFAVQSTLRAVLIAGESVKLRRDLNEAIDILSEEIKTISASAVFFAGTDTSIQLQSIIGSSTICQRLNTDELVLPGVSNHGALNDAMLTSWIDSPDSNDLVAVYMRSSSAGGSYNWKYLQISKVTTSANLSLCPQFYNGLTVVSGHSAMVLLVKLKGDLGDNDVLNGAPLRFLRQARFSMYRASDNGWYLGYKRCPYLLPCHTVQPVSGPYSFKPFPPLTFSYIDSSGIRLSSWSGGEAGLHSFPVAIGVSLRGESTRGGAGYKSGMYGKRVEDSVSMEYRLRNL